MDRYARSAEAHARARTLMPGGVNSPVRSGKAVGAEPLTIARGEGPFLFDVDGHRYVDYVLSWGPLALGHAHPQVLAALKTAAEAGTSFGAPCLLENELAAFVLGRMPNLERIRFVSSGTEAVMSALRLARAATGRDIVVKCSGCYHGHVDGLLVSAGSGAATLGVPTSPGVSRAVASGTVVIPYNDADAFERTLQAHPGQVAAIIVEPVAGNMGLVPPKADYLTHLHNLCDRHGALLIFDEVMTGFRVALGGAQARFGIRPDLTCLGKVVGGGLPCAAYGGRLDLMRQVAPEGPVYQAGTLSGNPLAMAAGLATLQGLFEPGVQEKMEATAAALAAGFQAEADRAGIPLSAASVGSMWGFFFLPAKGHPVGRWEGEVEKCDTARFGAFWRGMRDRGVYLAPAQFEAAFVSAAHGPAEIEFTLKAARETMATL